MTLKEKLYKGMSVIGTWCELPSPEVVNVLAKAGLDFVIIDMEHGPMDYIVASQMILAAESDRCSPLIRVSRNDESDILRALEISPKGIIVPHVESIEDRKKAISYIKFSPLGIRSFNPYTRAGSYQSSKDFTKKQNEDILSILIVEGKKGISQLNEIIDDKSVDVVYIGAYDLSVSLGIPGDTKNIKIINMLEDTVRKAKKKNKVVGYMFHDKEEYLLLKKLGIQFLCYKVDTSVILDSFKKITEFNK